MMQTHERSAVKTQGVKENAVAEPVNLLKRVGSTTYIYVAIRFSEIKNAEKPEDKVLRLIESEVRKLA